MGGNGNFNLNQIIARHPRSANVKIENGLVSVWNVFEITLEAVHILGYGYPLGQDPSNRINHELPLPQCIIMGIMFHHRNSGIEEVPANDIVFGLSLLVTFWV